MTEIILLTITYIASERGYIYRVKVKKSFEREVGVFYEYTGLDQ